jgi:hypothetical protein
VLIGHEAVVDMPAFFASLPVAAREPLGRMPDSGEYGIHGGRCGGVTTDQVHYGKVQYPQVGVYATALGRILVRLAAFAPRISARVETNWAWRATSFHVIFKSGDEAEESRHIDDRFVPDGHHYARSA